MQNRNFIVLGIAIVIGLVAVVLANSYFSGVQERQERLEKQQAVTAIVVASQPLEFGTRLSAQNVRMQNYPAASIPVGAFRSIAEALRDDRVALRPIVPNEPVLADKVSFDEFPPVLARFLRSIQRTLFTAAIPYGFTQTMGAMGLGFVLVFVVLVTAVIFAGITLEPGIILLLLVISGAIAVVLPLLVINRIAMKRRKRIEQQFPVSLDVFVRALRSGHPVAAAIDLLTREMEDPIGSEYGLVADEVAYGADLTDAISGMADRWDLEDIRMFVVSLSVQMETGGNLAEILENLSDVIRQRASLYLKVRALSSEGRMTGWMLTVLPILTLVGMFLVNPGFYLNVARDPIFMFGFPGLLILYLIGVLWIRKLVNLKV